MSHFTTTRKSRRGSLLIVAMLLCAVIGISLGSYLHLSRTALNISNRALYNNAAMNLAEQGIEEAMYSINQFVTNTAYGWPGWTIASSDAYRVSPVLTLGQNATAKYRVYMYNYRGFSPPKLVSRARVTLGSGGAPIEKWVEVTLGQTSKFSNGLVAKNSIVFDGNNPTVDCWNSEWDTTVSPRVARTPPAPYNSGIRLDNGSVGSISISTDAVWVKNADVWGYVSNNSGSALHPPEEFVGTQGSILGANSPTGSNVDPNRTSTTFSASFETAAVPAEVAIANLGNLNTDGVVLPRPGDTVPNGDPAGDYPGYFIYDAAHIDLDNKKLTINGKVVIRLSNTGSSISVGGGAGEISITSTGYLSLYTAGDVSIAGQGVSNGEDGTDTGTAVDKVSELGQPKKFQVWGTKASGTQTMAFGGLGLFSGIIYAPNAAVTIIGNGAICGSVVAGDIKLSGNAQFHYDESLASLGGDSPFRISKWKELTSAADRTAYEPVLSWSGP